MGSGEVSAGSGMLPQQLPGAALCTPRPCSRPCRRAGPCGPPGRGGDAENRQKEGTPRVNETKPRNWRKTVLVVLAAILIGLVLVAVYLYSQVSAVFDPGEAGSLVQDTDPDILQNGDRFYNILFLGIDYDEDDTGRTYADGKGMTDVIMYLQIDRDTGRVNILQIPRDSYTGPDLGGGVRSGTGKINEVYANGPDQKNLINNTANMVYRMFKLPVDNYVTIEMDAFKALLNAQGGIKMYVPWDIVHTDEKTGEETVLVSQGTHWVSGDTAEVILRNRNYAQADYKRLETQQYFYAALVRTFLEEYELPDYYAACKNVAHYINTDLDITELWGLYGTLTQIDPANIFIIRLPGGGTTMPEYPRYSCYALDRDKTAALLNTYFRDAEMPVEADKLEIATEADGVTWPYGVTDDPGKTLGTVDSGAGEAEP